MGLIQRVCLMIGFLYVPSIQAYPEHGIACTTTQDRTYSGWKKITGWVVDSMKPGQYISGVSFENSEVNVEKPGLYYVSVHILLANLTGEGVIISVVVNNDKENGLALHSSAKVQLDLAGYLLLSSSDVISIYGYSTKSFKVSKNSFFSLRFHDNVASTPGFSYSLAVPIELFPATSRTIIGPWRINGYGQFSSSSIFPEQKQIYQAPLEGIYMIIANIILTSIIKEVGLVEIGAFVDNEIVAHTNIHLSATSTVTMNINEILRVPKGAKVHLEIKTEGSRLNILDTSSFSFMLLKPVGVLSDGFHTNLKNSYNFTVNNEYQKIVSWSPNITEKYDFKDFHQSTIVDERSYSSSVSGVFYVVTHLLFTLYTQNRTDIHDVEVAFLGAENLVMLQTKAQTPFQLPMENSTYYTQLFSVTLAGNLELTPTEPIAVGIKAKGDYIIIDEISSFGILKAISTYPGALVSIDSPKSTTTSETVIVGWKTDVTGLYDFTDSVDPVSGSFTASENGVYLVTTNIVIDDVDFSIKGYVSKDKDVLTNVFLAKDGNPSLKSPLNFGGFTFLKEKDQLFLFLTSEDQEWKVFSSALSITYVSLNPSYFQAKLAQDVPVRSLDSDFELVKWNEISNTDILNSGKYIAPYDGVYFTVATVILKDADSNSPGSYYKTYLKVNNNAVNGLYAKRQMSTEEAPATRSHYTLFFSGTFYASKDSVISLALHNTGGQNFQILDDTQWGVLFVPSNDKETGALATLQAKTSFLDHEIEWQNVGMWLFRSLKTDGTFEYNKAASFEHPNYIQIKKEGLFLISANIDVRYTQSTRSLIRIAVTVNEEHNARNGMMQCAKSQYPAQTFHIAGTMHLKANDKIQIQISSDDFQNTNVDMTSGFSIVLIPEAEKPSSFSVGLKGDIQVQVTPSVSEIKLKDWYYTGLLSSSSFNLNNGELIAPMDGFYLLSGSFDIFADGESTSGANLMIKVNGITEKEITKEFSNSTKTLVFSQVMHLKALDVLYLMVLPSYNLSHLDIEYQQYLNNTNHTKGTNRTFVNPYTKLHLLVKEEKSSLSLVYLQNYVPSTSSFGEFTVNRKIDEINDAAEFYPWTLPQNPTSDGSGAFSVEQDGVYLLSSEISVSNITDTVQISFINNQMEVCSSIHLCTETCDANLKMKCLTSLKLNDMVKMVISNKAPHITVQAKSTRNIDYISTSDAGFNVIVTESQLYSGGSTDWLEIGPWTSNHSTFDGLFMKHMFYYENEMILQKSGTYQVTVNLLVRLIPSVGKRKRRNTISPLMEVAAFVNGVQDSNLYLKKETDPMLNTTTLTFIGSVSLMKWDRMKLKASYPEFHILSKSTWSATLIEPASFSRVEDIGPVVVSELLPDSIDTTVVGVKRMWECQAFADQQFIYRWFKNDQLYMEDNSATSQLSINGNINDTGTYQCVAELNNITSTSNKIRVEIKDIDECAKNLHDCSVGAQCVNTPGSYKCICEQGTTGDGRICTDFNECSIPNICLNNLCINELVHGYKCKCHPGYYGDDPYNKNCSDINECTLGEFDIHDCNVELGVCVNTNGSYNCTCMKGYVGDGRNCTDEDECKTGNYECDPNAYCQNLNGTYECLCIDSYYMGKDGNTCLDVNECLGNNTHVPEGICVEYAVCVNEPGTYGCKCPSGFTGNGTEKCIDIDECFDVNCNPHADCINVPGSYECKCHVGFEGNGFQCTDIDECKTVDGVCTNGNCTNQVGDFLCTCFEGYRSNGKLCVVDNNAVTAKIEDVCEADDDSYKCLCKDQEKRENNIMCNGLFVALLILTAVAIVVLIFVFQYLKKKKDMKIKPVRTHREKYIEMPNESEM